ncbi:MAG: hypothetical protein COA67_09185 [Lutibacter sp.]|nr:MAG: hypothetical protein COA67_09185 [Lutibacter sp.]
MKLENSTFFTQVKTALFFFVFSAFYGLILRLTKVVDFIPIAYNNLLQSHSHVTFLGWGFLAVISLVGFAFYPKILDQSMYLKRLFYIMVVTLLGMLISFPIQGYKLFSILFLSIFLIVSYLYLFRIYKELKEHKSYSSKFIKTAILYYLLSSLAIWAIAIVAVKFGKTTLYYNSIYFYLHFLYNGFFVFSLFGLLIKYLENKQVVVGEELLKYFYLLTNLSCIPAYAMSLLWSEVPKYVYFIAFFAAIIQLVSLYYLFSIKRIFFKIISSRQLKLIGIIVFVSYFLKIILQLISSFPVIIKNVVALKHYFIIGYIHLFTLGFMSLIILLLLSIISKVKFNRLGLNMLILGIILSEFVLFFQGASLFLFRNGIANINMLLLLVSALMPFGLLLILRTFKRTVK